MTDWNDIRAQYLVPDGLVFLNNGSYGPTPRPVFDAMVGYLRRLEENPSTFGDLFNRLAEVVKPKLAAFVGARPGLTAVVTNLTMGMNVISRGLRGLAPGDEVLVSDLEYGAVANAWDFTAKQKGWAVRRFPVPTLPGSPDDIVRAIDAAIGPRTRVVVTSHITTGTGLVLPVGQISALCRSRGVLSVIDGAHAPGMIPVDIAAIDCDFYAGNCHKWLGAPMGTAFFAAAERSWERLDPFVVGWGWNKDRPETFNGNFEHPGIHNVAISNAIGEAVDFQLAVGREAIAARVRDLADYGKDLIGGLPGVKLETPRDHRLCAAMTRYTFPPLADKDRFGRVMQTRRIVSPAGSGPDGGGGRLSTHIYNSRADVDWFADALCEIYGWD